VKACLGEAARPTGSTVRGMTLALAGRPQPERAQKTCDG
jgi:hypothetical protein